MSPLKLKEVDLLEKFREPQGFALNLVDCHSDNVLIIVLQKKMISKRR